MTEILGYGFGIVILGITLALIADELINYLSEQNVSDVEDFFNAELDACRTDEDVENLLSRYIKVG